jgi:hypothetical protein
MNLMIRGLNVSVPQDELARLVLDHLTSAQSASVILTPPPIGEVWTSQGGTYAGLCRGRDGGHDYHLIVGPEYDGTADWDAAQKWADELSASGFADYGLPFRKEQALCFANVPELFKPETYWSCEQHASVSDYAWGQLFDNGYQGHWTKHDKLRARAVRRLKI